MKTISSQDQDRLPIGVLVLVRDEERNLPDCLHSVSGWAAQVVVMVDSRTRDNSRSVAINAGAEVHERPFDTYAGQKNWALDHVNWRGEWILIIDADERVPPELVAELAQIVDDPNALEGYAVRKRFIFYGAWMKHCWHSSWDLRFFKRDKARYENRKVHEHMQVDGRVGYLKADVIHNDFKDLDSWIAKHNRYATLEADEIVEYRKDGHFQGRLFGSKLERRRLLKERLWAHLPFRPIWLFLYLYFLKLGFLDGALGLRFCVWHSVFDFFITGKAWERRFVERHGVPNYYRRVLNDHFRHNPEARRFYREMEERV